MAVVRLSLQKKGKFDAEPLNEFLFTATVNQLRVHKADLRQPGIKRQSDDKRQPFFIRFMEHMHSLDFDYCFDRTTLLNRRPFDKADRPFMQKNRFHRRLFSRFSYGNEPPACGDQLSIDPQ